jgi:hypothetical protein
MCIQEQQSTTRRSAGIPVLMTGIMAASPEHFDEIMKRLVEIAFTPLPASEEEQTSIPQVHAMNCLKEAFKNSSLSASCEPYVGIGLQLVAHSLKSSV